MINVNCLHCGNVPACTAITVQFQTANLYSCQCFWPEGNKFGITGFEKSVTRPVHDPKSLLIHMRVAWKDVSLLIHREFSSKTLWAEIRQEDSKRHGITQIRVRFTKDPETLTLESARHFVDTVLLMS